MTAKERPTDRREGAPGLRLVGQDALTTTLNERLDALDQALQAGRQSEIALIAEQLSRHSKAAAQVLADRVRSGRARSAAIAFELLMGFAGQRAPALLKQIAADSAVPDIVRWGARRRAGWAKRGQAKARRAFLASLQDAEDTLVTAVAQAGAWAPPDGEILTEVLEYLQVLAPKERLSVVRRAQAAKPVALPWLLRSLVHVEDPPLQTLCLDALVQSFDEAARGTLDRLVKTSRNAALVEAARAAARPQQIRVGAGVAQPPGHAEPPWPQVITARTTAVDVEGGQLVSVTRDLGGEREVFAGVYVSDDRGIADILGTYGRLSGSVEDLMREFRDLYTPDVEIDLPAARGILAAAVETAVAHGRALPPALELWEPYFHDTFPPAPDEPTIVTELDDARYSGRGDLVRRSVTLLDHQLFEGWFVQPEELEAALLSIGTSAAALLPGRPPYSKLIKALFGAEERGRLRHRLRRQAWLLGRLGEPTLRDIALATASSVVEASQADLARHVFLRAMIDLSLEAIAAFEPDLPDDYF